MLRQIQAFHSLEWGLRSWRTIQTIRDEKSQQFSGTRESGKDRTAEPTIKEARYDPLRPSEGRYSNTHKNNDSWPPPSS